MPDMLRMATVEFRNPLLFLVLVKSDNAPLHAAILTGRRWQVHKIYQNCFMTREISAAMRLTQALPSSIDSSAR